jgi:uncharacterized membrane protein YvlD (DUF360 family)
MTAMTWLIVKFAIRVVVFGVAIAFACRRFKHVKVEPRSALPIVAIVFAALNAVLYHLLVPVLNLVTLWSLFLIVPFAVNALLLLATDRVVKAFKIDGFIALAKLAGLLTILHIILRLAQL